LERNGEIPGYYPELTIEVTAGEGCNGHPRVQEKFNEMTIDQKVPAIETRARIGR
jgi:hypothetical protein